VKKILGKKTFAEIKDHCKFFSGFILALFIHGCIGSPLNWRGYLIIVGLFGAKYIVSDGFRRGLIELDYCAAKYPY
jgi:hypothetical protein